MNIIEGFSSTITASPTSGSFGSDPESDLVILPPIGVEVGFCGDNESTVILGF